MLTASVVGWTARVPGGLEDLGDDLRAGRPRTGDLGDPVRPDGVDAGKWRRMSRLARFVVGCGAELLVRHPEIDRSTLPVVYGSAMGEVVPSSAFLDRLFTEGPATASPLAFQNSVYNATSGHLAMALGLTGPSETVSAGMATGLAALARGIEVLVRHPFVLVVVADDLNPTTRLAYANTGPAGEAVVAVLLRPGTGITVWDGVHGTGERFARGTALPYEAGLDVLPGERPEACIGLHPANGLLAVLSTGLPAVDQDGSTALTACYGAVPAEEPR